jgi:hypothetical protein
MRHAVLLASWWFQQECEGMRTLEHVRHCFYIADPMKLETWLAALPYEETAC